MNRDLPQISLTFLGVWWCLKDLKEADDSEGAEMGSKGELYKVVGVIDGFVMILVML